MKIYRIYISALILIVSACHDQYLDLKSDQGKVIPSSLADFEKIINNDNKMNTGTLHFLMNISADEYYLTESDWSQLTDNYQRNGALWLKDIYGGNQCVGWNNAYQKILYANVVLEGLNTIPKEVSNIELWKNVFGSAMFYRGWTFYQLAQVFCEDYAIENLPLLGIPLKLSSDIDHPIERATIDQTYQQVISDLSVAADLLPVTQQSYNRPTKSIAHAVLAKVYLQMEDYQNSLLHAEMYLKENNVLIDYNDLDADVMYPFPTGGEGNPEYPYFELMYHTLIFGPDRIRVDTALYNMYDDDDLRKHVFFYQKNGEAMFGGSYSGYHVLTGAPATNEIYLIAAEMEARLNNAEQSLMYLNKLLENRYEKGTFLPVKYSGQDDLIQKIFTERRKELVLKGTRWSDLRRFRKYPKLKTDLKRSLNGAEYQLSARSPNWVWPIPDNAIALGGYEQNQRE